LPADLLSHGGDGGDYMTTDGPTFDEEDEIIDICRKPKD
jgi:hypothetical protein